MAFSVMLILLGAGGLVVDARAELGPGYGWLPGAALACVVIGTLLLLGRLASNGGRGFGVALAGGGLAGLLAEREYGWLPDQVRTVAQIALVVAVVVGVLAWISGMYTEHGAGGLGAALAVVALASLVADSAARQPAPWDASLNVLTAACAAGALSAGLAGFGSLFEDDDLLMLAYAWLTSAVAAGLGVAATALVAASAFAEPRWAFALLVVAVVAGLLGAAAAVVFGVRALGRHREEFAAYQRLRADEAVRRRLGLDEDADLSTEDSFEPVTFTDEELAGLGGRSGAGPDSAARRRAAGPGPVPAHRRRGWAGWKTAFALTADAIGILGGVIAAVRYLTG